MDRNKIAVSDTWALEDIFPSEADFESTLKDIENDIPSLKAYCGTLSKDSDTLLNAITLRTKMYQKLERCMAYANLSKSLDNGNPSAQRMCEMASHCMYAVMEAASFMEPELIRMDSTVLSKWLEDERFSDYRFLISDVLRAAPHTLDEAGERLLSLAGDPIHATRNAFTMFNNVDADLGTCIDEQGNTVKLTHGNYGVFIRSASREVRESAYRSLYHAFRSYSNTVAAIYAASVKGDVFTARARNFPSSLEAALFPDQAPVSVYEGLIAAIHEKLPAMQRYLELRKRVLKVDRLEMYDLYTPIVADVDMSMDFTAAKALVKTALKPLGEEYGKLLDKAFSSRWCDVYETPGKTTGAFSYGVSGVHPYVLLNQQDDLESAFTTAHELGHAMHSWLSDHAQPYPMAEYRIMAAEVASTVNEQLLMRYLLSVETDPRKRAYLLNQELENYRTTCFRQVMFAEFELEIHRMAERGVPLTAESMSAVYRNLNEEYYPGVHVDDDIASEWMRIPHFYTAFYVYQYATGICAATAIAQHILSTGDTAGYFKFLSSGGSEYPIEELKYAGVDLTDKKTILNALSVFEQDIEELNSLIG